MKNILIALLLVLIISPCTILHGAEEKDWGAIYEKGKSDARLELSRGNYYIEYFGYPPPWIVEYRKILKERYGIEHKVVAGCVVDSEMTIHADGFNEVMVEAIKLKFGEDVFKNASREAEEDWEAKAQAEHEERMKEIAEQ